MEIKKKRRSERKERDKYWGKWGCRKRKKKKNWKVREEAKLLSQFPFGEN